MRALNALVVAATLGFMLGAVAPTSATPLASDPKVAELRDFAAQLDAASPNAGAEAAVVTSLREFASRIGAPEGARGVQVAASKPVKAAVPVKAPVGAEAMAVGSRVCLGCHAVQAAEFNKTLMGRINRTTRKGSFECENCHGPGSLHVAAGGGRGVGGIISFRPEDQSRDIRDNNKICLGCHEKGDRTYWSGSTHDMRGLACTNCHTVMRQVTPKFALTKQTELETCFQCHKDRRAQLFRTSHMPLREGKMTCSSCHNPHGTENQALVREKSINENCYKCHAEKRGPFLFEHAPVRENCLACHDAHGSTNEFLLNVPRPRLCAECHGFGHGLTSGPLAVQTFSRSCQNCHTEVHGTNSPSGALLHR